MIISLKMSKNHLTHTVLKEIGFTLLAEGKTIKVKADGFSMYPAIKPGSIIYIQPAGMGIEPVPGDIIAWKRDSGLVVHRLVRILEKENKTFFITRGDSSASEDQPVIKDQIAGKVIHIEFPEGKSVSPMRGLINQYNYLINRILVWMILRLKQLKRLFMISLPAP